MERKIPNEEKLDQQAFPRMLAMSEVLWSKEKELYKFSKKSRKSIFYFKSS